MVFRMIFGRVCAEVFKGQGDELRVDMLEEFRGEIQTVGLLKQGLPWVPGVGAMGRGRGFRESGPDTRP